MLSSRSEWNDGTGLSRIGESSDDPEDVIDGLPDANAISRVPRNYAAVRGCAIRGGGITVNSETRTPKHLIPRIRLQNDGRETRMGRVDQSCHAIQAQRQWADVMLILQCRIVYARAVARIASKQGDAIVLKHSCRLGVNVHGRDSILSGGGGEGSAITE
jgi:hypothetical protein